MVYPIGIMKNVNNLCIKQYRQYEYGQRAIFGKYEAGCYGKE